MAKISKSLNDIYRYKKKCMKTGLCIILYFVLGAVAEPISTFDLITNQ